MDSRKTIPIMQKDTDQKESENRALIKVVDRPTFILKTREGESRAVSPSQRNGNKKEVDSQPNASTKSPDPRTPLWTCVEMTNCTKFMDENMVLSESPLDLLYDQQDFLVIGCIGTQGVGKSTVMSLLTSNYVADTFPVQTLSHHESGANCTSGIDFYVTRNRVIYLDVEPILSAAAVDYSASFDQKKNSSDFVTPEVNLELQSLQLTAFLFSICHVIIFVQDWFADPNLVRFLQTAEMLKPLSTNSMDHQDYIEYYPHLLFLHNKAELHDFLPSTVETMKEFYNKAFTNSRLQTHSGLDMSEISLEGQLNLFLIPNFTTDDEPRFHESQEQLVKKLRRKIHGVSRNAMTPSTLTEKNWYHYASKVVDAIKKSHFFSEYGRLMP